MEDAFQHLDWGSLEQNGILTREEAMKVLKLVDVDPLSSLVKMRSIIENLIKILYELYYSQQPTNLNNAIKILNEEKKVFPAQIYIFFNTLRLTGNAATHQSAGTKEDIIALLPLFLHIMNWFIQSQLPIINQSKQLSDLTYDSDGKITPKNSEEILVPYLTTMLYESQYKVLQDIERKYNFTITLLSIDNNLSGIRIRKGNITEICFRDSNLTEFPPELRNLKKIMSIDLCLNKISQIPTWLSELSELEYLNLERNPIKEFPKVLSYLPNLKYLVIPYSLYFDAKKLLSDNHVQIKSISHLSNPCIIIVGSLIFIYILSEIQSEFISRFFLSGFYSFLTIIMIITFGFFLTCCTTSVDKSSLKKNEYWTPSDKMWEKIGKIEQEIEGKMQNIKRFSLIGFDTYYQCKNHDIVKIVLKNQKMTQIPDVIYSITSLQSLDLRSNHLFSISDRIGELKELKKLEISNNPLISLTDAILNLPNLAEINIPYRLLKDPIVQACKNKQIRITWLSQNQMYLIYGSFFWIIIFLLQYL